MPIVTSVGKVDVLVVGAGITGLSTAYAAQKAGCSVAVVEASDHVGGRIMTREWQGDKVEVGQQYILSTYAHALALVEELGMTGDLIVEKARVVQHIDKKGQSHILDGEADLLRFLGMRGSADLARATLQYATLGKPFPSYEFEAYVEEYDNVSAAEGFAWAGDKFRDFVLRPMCYGNAGTSLDHLSLFDAVRLFRSHLKQPTHYGFRNGNMSLPLKLVEQMPVLLNSEVSELSLSGDRVTGVKLVSGDRIEAGHVIVCTTPGAAARITPDGFSGAKAFLERFHHTPLALAFFHLDRPLDSAAVSFGIASPQKRQFNMSINHTITRPFLVPSGKAIISGWTAFPNAADMLAKPDHEVLSQALGELKLFYPGLSEAWVEHSEVIRHEWGYALQQPGDWKRLFDFNAMANAHKGLSFANADYSMVALESGIITGKAAAARAVESLREKV